MHTGGLEGMVTQITLILELQLGIIVFTNQQAGAAFNAVTSTIKDSYLGIPPIDRVKQISAIVKADQAEAAKISSDIWTAIAAQEKKSKQKVDLKAYTGTYHDKWFGDIIISLKKRQVVVRCQAFAPINRPGISLSGANFYFEMAGPQFRCRCFRDFCTK